MSLITWNQCVLAAKRLSGLSHRRTRRVVCFSQLEPLEDRVLLAAAPVAVNDVYSVPAGTSFSAPSVLINDSDSGGTLDQATLQSGVSHGVLTFAQDGTFTYLPDTGFSGTDFFTYFATDTGNALTSMSSARVTLHVGTTNSAPFGSPTTIDATMDTPFDGSLTATDPNGDPLTFSAGSTAATNGTVTINPDGTYVFTPSPGFTGTGSFSYFASDGTINSADSTVTVNIGAAGTNAAPTTQSIVLVTAANTPLNGLLSGTDVNGNPLTFSPGAAAATNGTVLINPDGTYVFTPNTGFTGIATFTYRANDGILNSTDSTATIHVGVANSLPTVTSATVSTDAGVSYFGTLASSDPNGDPLTFSPGSTPAENGTVVVNPDGSFIFTPADDFAGPGTFSYFASDGLGNSIDGTQTVNIGDGLGAAPSGTPASVSTAAGTPFTGNLQGTATNGNDLTFSAGATSAANGTVLINPDGSYTYTPNAGFSGVDTFSFNTNDGTRTSQDSNVIVHVGGTNSLPVVSSVTFSTNTNSAFSGTLVGTDADGDPLTFTAGTTAAANGTVQINPDGTFVFTPNTDFTGAGTFSFDANDTFGSSNIATATINIGPSLNQAPVGTASSITTDSDTSFSGNLQATDADGNNLTYSAGTVTAAHGTAVINSDGTYTYSPVAGYAGPDSFTFKAFDGTVNSPDTTVTVQVDAADTGTGTGTGGGVTTNAPPVVIDSDETTNFRTNLNGSLSPLGTDAEGSMLNYAAVTQPENGTLSMSPDGTFTYVPDIGFSGADSFFFKANDGDFDSNVGMFNITVNAPLMTLEIAPTGTIGTSKKSTLPLDNTASLVDIDPSVDFRSVSIVVGFNQGGDIQHDKLLITQSSSSQILVRGKKVLVDGKQLATFSGGSHGQKLRLAFSSDATADDVNSVIQQIGARTTKRSSESVRSIQIEVDAIGSSATALIDVSKS